MVSSNHYIEEYKMDLNCTEWVQTISDPLLLEKYKRLKQLLLDMKQVIIAYSGGIDSAFLLKVAQITLADQCIALTAVSESYAPWEREEAQKLAMEIGAKQIEVFTKELDNPSYRANVGDRCYHCKTALFDTAVLTQTEYPGVLCYGAISDDLGDDRPGMKAAQERGIRAPLIEAGLYKADIRILAKALGLRIWDKPASACLSSRFPYGTQIDAQKLDQITRCEGKIRALGLIHFRARFHEKLLRLEFGPKELERVFAEASLRDALIQIGKSVGFQYVTLDLAGYRMAGQSEMESGLVQIGSKSLT